MHAAPCDARRTLERFPLHSNSRSTRSTSRNDRQAANCGRRRIVSALNIESQQPAIPILREQGNCSRAYRPGAVPKAPPPFPWAKRTTTVKILVRTLNPQPPILNPQPSTLHPPPSALNPPPSTLHPSPSTLKPQASTLNPHPSTLCPPPSTLHPPPSTLFLPLKPWTLDPKPEALNPKPQTPNPEPKTPSPKPQTPNSTPETPQPSSHRGECFGEMLARGSPI